MKHILSKPNVLGISGMCTAKNVDRLVPSARHEYDWHCADVL